MGVTAVSWALGHKSADMFTTAVEVERLAPDERSPRPLTLLVESHDYENFVESIQLVVKTGV